MTLAEIFLREELILKLQQFSETFAGSRQIVAFYLFGSYAEGKPTPFSDIDLAVLFDKYVNHDCYLDERLRLMGELAALLGTDKIDLVVLNELPPGLAYRVIRDGELLFSCQETRSQLVEYKVKVMDRYFDFQPTQRIFSEGLARRIREGSFGGR